MSKLLLIDDDCKLAELLKSELAENGWQVEIAHDFADGWQLLSSFSFDMILLDWTLPDGTGLKLCRDFRDSGGTTPIIFLTGKTDMDSMETGLDTGADDYITKPFDVREILARIRSVQRRPAHYLQTELKIRGVSLDKKLMALRYNDATLRLSATEFSIMEFFFRHLDQIFSSSELFAKIWPSDSDAKETTVRVHMHLLRKKLEPLGLKDFIKTIKSTGYILESDADE